MITTHIYYKTSDGKEFLEKELAELHEEYVKQLTALERDYQGKISAINMKRLQAEWPKTMDNLVASAKKAEPEYTIRNEGYENHYNPVGRD